MQDIEIRLLTELDELEEVETLQHIFWGDAALHRNMLISMVRNGAILLGAVKDKHIIGFVLGYLGTESPDAQRPAMANLKLASQRMGILPEYRDKGIGFELKLAQRQYAIKQGIRLITWTFDPLLSRNAYLNTRKLGAIIRDFKRDYYGTKPSPQVTLGSSDRAIVEWWVTSQRVEQRLSGKRSPLVLPQYIDAGATVLNLARVGPSGYLQPNGLLNQPTSPIILIEIPENFAEMVEQEPELAREWRHHNREIMQWALGSGYAVTDFVRGELEGCMRSFYALTSYYDGLSMGNFSNN